MQPLEPDLSFIAQRYLNHIENYLTRFIDHFRAIGQKTELHASPKQYYTILADVLKAFQNEVPQEQRSVLHLAEPEKDTFKIHSVFRLNPTGVPNELISFQFERFPRDEHCKASCLGAPKALQRVLDDKPELSLTCLLHPVFGLMEALRGAGWTTVVDIVGNKTVMTALSDGRVVVYIVVNIEEFILDTIAIKEYHANKEKKDAEQTNS